MTDATIATERPSWRRLLLEEAGTGMADRRAFLGGILLVLLLLAVATVTFTALFEFGERLSADGAVGGLTLVAQLLGFAIAGTVALVGGVLAFAFANLIAKRMRDLGLPGWKALGIAWLLGAATSLGTPLASAIAYIVVVWSVLLFMPSPRHRRR